jgi:phosphatidylglycerophosphatase C
MQADRQVKGTSDEVKLQSPDKGTQKKKLVLFDFDGTITTKDTLLEFLLFAKGKASVAFGFAVLSPILLLYAARLIPNWKAKQLVLKYFIGNSDVNQFNKTCSEFAARVIPTLVRPKARHIIEQYLRDNATVIVVSASPENWVGPWCERLGLKYLATQLDVVNNKITGNICGKNCYGPEKVNRIKSKYLIHDYDEIIAYGDSSGDLEMFRIAHQNFYKPFRD